MPVLGSRVQAAVVAPQWEHAPRVALSHTSPSSILLVGGVEVLGSHATEKGLIHLYLHCTPRQLHPLWNVSFQS